MKLTVSVCGTSSEERERSGECRRESDMTMGSNEERRLRHRRGNVWDGTARLGVDSFHNPNGKALGVLQKLLSDMAIKHFLHPW